MKRNSQTFSQIIDYSSFLKASNSTTLGIYLLAISLLGYKQQSLSNYTVCTFLGLSSFTWCNYFEIHTYCCVP